MPKGNPHKTNISRNKNVRAGELETSLLQILAKLQEQRGSSQVSEPSTIPLQVADRLVRPAILPPARLTAAQRKLSKLTWRRMLIQPVTRPSSVTISESSTKVDLTDTVMDDQASSSIRASEPSIDGVGSGHSSVSHGPKRKLNDSIGDETLSTQMDGDPKVMPFPSSASSNQRKKNKNILRLALNRLFGPRLNPQETRIEGISVTEGPFDAQVRSHGESKRPVSWPRSRTWRKSVGEATKDIGKPIPERDYAKEAQAKAKRKEVTDADIKSKLVQFGLLGPAVLRS